MTPFSAVVLKTVLFISEFSNLLHHICVWDRGAGKKLEDIFFCDIATEWQNCNYSFKAKCVFLVFCYQNTFGVSMCLWKGTKKP